MNERIRSREIRVVDEDGSQLGVMTPWDALQKAQERGLDLVEVAPGANPPVCRIMDYGKYKYEQKKKQAASKAKAHAATLKEVKLRPRTDDHDLDFKVRSARRFLIEGDKVKVTLMFRGREIVHTSLGFDQLDRVKTMLADIANVESTPRLEGRFMSMILVPNRDAIARLERARQQAEGAEGGEGGGSGEAGEPAETKEAAGEEPAAGDT
ncbi:MAG TPA: translation initiation factor IF-3 [Myxococcota bacterium]|nr:translation initiation factor IF-3 [Myxococcota bacterium]